VQPRPVIGIAMQTLEPIPGQLPLCWVMGQKYVCALTEVGAVPWLIPLLTGDEETLRAIYEAADGIFLTGGVDVDPAAYGEPRHELCGRTDPDRDWTELCLIRWALEDQKPVLGVCRGIQVMNVAAGGTLYQDVNAQYDGGMKHDYFPPADGYERTSLTHDAEVAPGSHLGRILGHARVRVNSMHHQGIKSLAPGFRPTAHAPDGLIEGIESDAERFLIGVQWHPEELAPTRPDMRRLFSAFVEAARAYKRKSAGLSSSE
jgi:putative glutamine amidotransferase